jgi:hypothetical protein
LHPPSATQASHWSNVTSFLPMANGFAIVTRCGGFSYSVVEPMSNVPAGSTSISTQPWQSRKTSPAFALLAAGADVPADGAVAVTAGAGAGAAAGGGCGAGVRCVGAGAGVGAAEGAVATGRGLPK